MGGAVQMPRDGALAVRVGDNRSRPSPGVRIKGCGAHLSGGIEVGSEVGEVSKALLERLAPSLGSRVGLEGGDKILGPAENAG